MANKASAWWHAHNPTTRRLIQVYAALLYNANVKGFISGEIYTGSTKIVCVPGFNCYSCPSAIGACPLGALQNALASSGNRAPYYVFGILMLFGLTLGRTICGWLCPLGLIQELLHKIPTPKLCKNRFTHALSYLKYVILAVFVIGIPLAYSLQYYPVPGFCKYICPAGTLEGAVSLLANPANSRMFSILGILFTRKFIIMILIFAACVFIYRAFCRFLCPLGALYGLFARVNLIGVKVEPAKCTHCGKCVSACEMDIKGVGDHECIDCGKCINVCPTKAIQLKCGKITLMANEGASDEAEKRRVKTRSTVAWCIALAVLAGALLYFNLPAAQTNDLVQAPVETAAVVQTEDDTPVGKEIGMRCPDFTSTLYHDGGEFTLSSTRGKVTVINFWATWCTPCVGELPYFQKLYDTYGDQIAIVALHAVAVSDDVEAFLTREGYSFPFGLDATGAIYQSLTLETGSAIKLPMTLVLDQDGKIVFNQNASVTYEQLDALVAPLLAK